MRRSNLVDGKLKQEKKKRRRKEHRMMVMMNTKKSQRATKLLVLSRLLGNYFYLSPGKRDSAI